MTLAIEARGLACTFGRHTAVAGIDLAVRPGTVFGFLGLNGAGKTTTVRILTTLQLPTAGRARILGHDVVADPRSVRRAIGLVGDEGGDSRPAWTAREYLAYFAALHERPLDVEGVLDLVGLERAWRQRPLGTLSTGMRRRVELARALLGRPRVLFLDEPTRGLDLPAKRETWSLLRSLSRQGVTLFLSSHETAEIQALCDEIAVVAAGRIVHRGSANLGGPPQAFEDRLVRLMQGAAPRPATVPAQVGRWPMAR